MENLLKVMDKNFSLSYNILDNKELNLNNDYHKINYTYYSMFCTHYESFLILIQNNHFSSAILLLRTMIELYVKSYYLEFIERKNDMNIVDLLEDKKKFPNFFEMVKKLEEHNDILGAKFDGTFKQFTKSELASYEKISLFSHGKGEYLKTAFENQKISFSSQQINDVLKTAKGLFETLSLLLMYIQGFNDEVMLLIEQLKKNRCITNNWREIFDPAAQIL